MSRSQRFVETLENRTLLTGQLDPSFGSGGKVTVDFHGPQVQSTVVAIQADGKTVVAGRDTDASDFNNTDIALTRFNVNGTLDTTFGPNHTGIVRTNGGFPPGLFAASSDPRDRDPVGRQDRGRRVHGQRNVRGAVPLKRHPRFKLRSRWRDRDSLRRWFGCTRNRVSIRRQNRRRGVRIRWDFPAPRLTLQWRA